jgi:hypothetical protein
MLEEAFWSPAHRKIIFGKYLQQKQKSGPSGRSLQRGEGGRERSLREGDARYSPDLRQDR